MKYVTIIMLALVALLVAPSLAIMSGSIYWTDGHSPSQFREIVSGETLELDTTWGTNHVPVSYRVVLEDSSSNELAVIAQDQNVMTNPGGLVAYQFSINQPSGLYYIKYYATNAIGEMITPVPGLNVLIPEEPNLPPTISFSPEQFSEEVGFEGVVATATFSDPEGVALSPSLEVSNTDALACTMTNLQANSVDVYCDFLQVAQNVGVQVSVSDGVNSPVSGTVVVQVIEPQLNTDPVVDIVASSFSEEVGFAGVVSQVTFSDADGDALDLSVSSSNGAVATCALQNVQSSTADLYCTLSSQGSATVTVTANDNNGGIVTDFLPVTVTQGPVNTDPVVDIVASSFSEEVGFAGVVSQVTFSDADGDALDLSVSSSNGVVATCALQNVQSSTADLYCTLPSQGSATVTVTANDNNGGIVTDTLPVTVFAASNHAPTIDVSSLTFSAAVGFSGVVSGVVFSDLDNDPLTFSVSSSSPNVVCSLTNIGANTADLSCHFLAEASDVLVAVTATDPSDASASDTITIDVVGTGIEVISIQDITFFADEEFTVQTTSFERLSSAYVSFVLSAENNLVYDEVEVSLETTAGTFELVPVDQPFIDDLIDIIKGWFIDEQEELRYYLPVLPATIAVPSTATLHVAVSNDLAVFLDEAEVTIINKVLEFTPATVAFDGSSVTIDLSTMLEQDETPFALLSISVLANDESLVSVVEQANNLFVVTPLVGVDFQTAVVFEISDADGSVIQATVPVVYTAQPVDEGHAPFATFTISGDLLVGEQVTFDARYSYDADGEIVNYYWIFSDGREAFGPERDEITLTFEEPGTYTATLGVLDNDGNAVFTTKTFTIEEQIIGSSTDFEIRSLSIEGTGSGFLQVGEPGVLRVTLYNNYGSSLDDLRVQLRIPELGLRVSSSLFDLRNGETTSVVVPFMAPYDAVSGYYQARVTVMNDDIMRQKSREIFLEE
ncbi:MAG: PKD domain-containing protein [Candidatus Woesearchaeota archaeon]|nr:MAG: PKD domain-containing protein [Candidatus Woesearchaeota archaeon]